MGWHDIVFSLRIFVYFCSHYFVHGGWFPAGNHLLDNVDKIRHLPATIIQGRYDVVTPMKTAWELHKVSIHVLYNLHTTTLYVVVRIVGP